MKKIIQGILSMGCLLVLSQNASAMSACQPNASLAPQESCAAIKGLDKGQHCEDFYVPAGITTKRTGNYMLCKENTGKNAERKPCKVSQQRCKIEVEPKN